MTQDDEAERLAERIIELLGKATTWGEINNLGTALAALVPKMKGDQGGTRSQPHCRSAGPGNRVRVRLYKHGAGNIGASVGQNGAGVA